MDYPAENAASLPDFVDIVWRRRWTALAIVLIVLPAAFYFTSRQPLIYTSNAAVLVRPISIAGNTQPATLNLDTETKLASSTEVARIAADELGSNDPLGLLSGLSVAVETNTEILDFDYEASSPTIAQQRAQAFADAYIRFRRDQASQSMADAAAAAQAQIDAINNKIQTVQDKLAAGPSSTQTETLRAEFNSLNGQLGILQAQATAAPPAMNFDVGEVVKPAERPLGASSPSYSKNLLIALFAAIILAIGAALLRERLDTRVRSREDLESMIGAPLLASIPNIAAWRRRKTPLLVATSQPNSPAAEAYRTLRTALVFAASQRKAKTVLITSAQAAEGKSATVANLGVVLAQAGKRVVLVSADLRKPRLAQFFASPSRIQGLGDVLLGRAEPKDVMMQTREPNLKILPAGKAPARPGELLASKRMPGLLSLLRQQADLILIDSPPLLATADALELIPFVDAVLFVVDASRTTRAMVADARERLFNVQAPVIGAILNNLDHSQSGSYAAYKGDDDVPVDHPVPSSAFRA